MKLALFSSVGYSTNIISHYLLHMKEYCDLFVNYYLEEKSDYFFNLKTHSKYISNIYTTKFLALKHAFINSNISEYDYIFIFDDDCCVEYGNLIDIPIIMSKYNLDIASGCHSPNGKVSHDIMRCEKGNHIFRYTNFVEMNFPVFSKYALNSYMKVFNNELCGWGNDWWYLSVVCGGKDAHLRVPKNCGIIDNVCVKNDTYEEKTMSINNFMKKSDRHRQWIKVKQQKNLQEWDRVNLGFEYE